MPIPETTSAEAFEHYVGGQIVRACHGPAWRELKAWVIEPPRLMPLLPLPAVSEPFLVWQLSGEVDFGEREGSGPWLSHRIRRGSFFLTSGGAPYDCRWTPVTDAPFRSMAVFLSLPLLQQAMDEVWGADAGHVRLRDVSAFRDDALHTLMEHLHAELLRREASPLCVQGLAQAIAVYLARHYTDSAPAPRSGSPSLPGYKLKQLTDWMAAHLTEACNLDRLAAQVKLSKFHFLRLFKTALGVSPARYHTNLRLDAARRLLRETDQGIVEIALAVGYANPSHFAQLFRRHTGLSPSDYRRQR